MLYICTDDFFNHVDELKRTGKLTREEEKELARKMKDGDEYAKKKMMDSYLPVLAAYLKRYTNKPSLEIIYRGIEVLETSMSIYDFQFDSPSPNVTFGHFLADKIKRMMTRYIAEKPIG